MMESLDMRWCDCTRAMVPLAAKNAGERCLVCVADEVRIAFLAGEQAPSPSATVLAGEALSALRSLNWQDRRALNLYLPLQALKDAVDALADDLERRAEDLREAAERIEASLSLASRR